MAFVPLLGIATEADTLGRVEKEPIPVGSEPTLVTRSEAAIPEGAVLATRELVKLFLHQGLSRLFLYTN